MTILPVIGGLWVATCTILMAFGPAFTTGRDHLVGAAVGFTIGMISAAVLYVGVMAIFWTMGGIV